MKILNEMSFVEGKEGVADIFLTTSEGKHWAMLRWERDAHKFGGMVGSNTHDGLAVVRPVRMSNAAITAENVGTFCIHAFLMAARIEAIDPAIEFKDTAAKVDAWDAFLAGPGAASKKKTAVIPPNTVELASAVHLFMQSTNLAKVNGNKVVMNPKSGAIVGEMLSGFEAIKFQNLLAGKFKAVKPVPELDLDAARTALASVGRPSSQAVTWYGTGEGTQKIDRAQVAKAYPLFAGMIADNPIMARTVDAREAIQPLLMERTGLGKAGLKRMSALKKPLPATALFEDGVMIGEDAMGVNRQRRYSVTGAISLDSALRYLNELPPDRVPQDDQSWEIYHDIVAGFAVPIENALGIPVAKTLSAVKGDWKQFHATMAKAADFAPKDFDRRAIALATVDAIEALEDFNCTAILPLMLSSIAEEQNPLPDPSAEFFQGGLKVASKFILGDSKNIPNTLLEFSRSYVSRIPTLMEATGFAEGEDKPKKPDEFAFYGPEEFPAIMQPFKASNGIVIRNLDNFDQMRRESSRLSHCVGRVYLGKAKAGRCHILSFQDASGSKSYSTLELSGVELGVAPLAARGKFRITQHRAKSNGRPDEACMAAERELMQAIYSGDLPMEIEKLQRWGQAERHDGVQAIFSWRGILGMEWEEKERRDAAWGVWREIIGGAAGKSPHPGVMWRDAGARRLIAEMSPLTAGALEARARDAAKAAAAEKEAKKLESEAAPSL